MSRIVAPETSDFHLTGYAQTSITIDTGYKVYNGYEVKGGGEMFAPLGKDLAKIRAESLRDDGGPRSTKEPGRLRRTFGHAFVVAGERLLRECRAPHAVRIGGGG